MSRILHADNVGPPYPHPDRQPCPNGKIEAFWAILQAEVLDRQHLADLASAEAAVIDRANYYSYHRLYGAWLGRPWPSGSTAPRSPTMASSTSRHSQVWPTFWRT